MNGMMKHIGKVTNTGSNCVVVYLQIPGRETHSLIVSVDNLPLSIENALMSVLQSPEGQGARNLGDVLGRRRIDGGADVLTALHDQGLLHPMLVDNIVMFPKPNMGFPLRQIIEGMGGIVPRTLDANEDSQINKFNPYAEAPTEVATEQKRGIAHNLLVEAAEFESIAKAKREEAYRHDPSLRPTDVSSVFTSAINLKTGDLAEATVLLETKKRPRTRKTKSDAKSDA